MFAKKIVVDWEYKAIQWDEDWRNLVDPMINADIVSSIPPHLQQKFDRRYVYSVECESYAEKVLSHFGESYQGFEFSAYCNTSLNQNNRYWSILVRLPNKRPIPLERLKKIQSAAKVIAKSLRLNYPSAPSEEEKAIEKPGAIERLTRFFSR